MERLETDVLALIPRLVPGSCYVVDESMQILAAEDPTLADLGISVREFIGHLFHPLATNSLCTAEEEASGRDGSSLLKPSGRLVSLACNHATRTFIYSGKPMKELMDNPSGLYLLVGHDVTGLVNTARDSQYRALHDPLTGAYSRWFLEELLSREKSRSKRTRESIGFVYVDIDHFKKINDTYGHKAGDRVLRTLAKTLQSQVRESDAVVRLGGDEFLLILPGLGNCTKLVEERIATAVSDCAKRTCQEFPPFGISIGSSSWTPSMKRRVADMIDEADFAMYAARLRKRSLGTQSGPDSTPAHRAAAQRYPLLLASRNRTDAEK